MKRDESCKDCYWCEYDREREWTSEGECHHGSPHADPKVLGYGHGDYGDSRAKWPTVRLTQYCGDFRPYSIHLEKA